MDEKDDSRLNGPWMIFPEIIGVVVVALYAPYYLLQIMSEGRVVLSLAGFIGWFIGVYYTIRFFKERQYFFAWLPMTAVLGVGLLVHYTLYPQ